MAENPCFHSKRTEQQVNHHMKPLSGAIKILILDDNEADREMCRRLLARAAPAGRYQFIDHGCLAGAMDVARAEKPHCILLDYSLQDGTGVDFLRGLQACGGALESAVVMLTGMGSEFIAVESFKTGAQDYLMKDRLTSETLHNAVESAISTVRTRHRLDAQHRERDRLLHELREEKARRERFMGTLSHHLRTPLTPVMIAAGILRDTHGHSEEVRKIASVILSNAELQARVIDEMLGPVIPKSYGL
ncbi:MAG: response regulator [Verrucomicrobiaceae bacterium]|nr:MAG: response regulator [Verrucomicrobiaceae bacterium]